MSTVKKLRKAGFVVKVRHNRFYDFMEKPDGEELVVGSKGGWTDVAIYKWDRLISHGHSHCCGIDNYNRKLGVKIALGRALKGFIV